MEDDLFLNVEDDVNYELGDNAGDSPSSGRSSVCSIPGSPANHRSGRALRREGQRDLHSSSFSVSSEYRLAFIKKQIIFSYSDVIIRYCVPLCYYLFEYKIIVPRRSA